MHSVLRQVVILSCGKLGINQFRIREYLSFVLDFPSLMILLYTFIYQKGLLLTPWRIKVAKFTLDHQKTVKST